MEEMLAFMAIDMTDMLNDMMTRLSRECNYNIGKQNKHFSEN